MSNIDYFETDYVYEDTKANEFKNIHIKLNVGKDAFMLELTADELPEKDAVKDILNQLESNAFKRLRISIIKDCRIVIYANNKKYDVTAEDTGIVVTKISLAED